MKRHLPVLTAIASTAFGAGFYVHRSADSPEPKSVNVISLPSPPPSVEETTVRFSKAWDAALAGPDSPQRTEAILAALEKAGPASLAELAARYADDPDTLQLIILRWAELDPRAAANWCSESRREGRAALTMLDTAVEVWAARDPAGLAAWFKEPVHIVEQYRLLTKLTGALFARDPAAALALAKEFPDNWSLPPEAIDWVEKDPAAAARTLASLALNWKSVPLAEKAAAAWAAQDGPGAAAWAAEMVKLRGPGANSLLLGAVKAWAAHDALAALGFTTNQPHGNRFAYEPLQQLASKDPAAAVAWITNHAHPSERLSLAHGAFLAAAKNDPATAAAQVNQMPDGSLRDKALAAVSEVWAKSHPADAFAWIAGQPNSPGREDALTRAANSWAKTDPATAAAWVKSAPEGSLPLPAYETVMDALRPDTAAAYAWLNELPLPAARSAVSRFMLNVDGESVRAAFALPDAGYKPMVIDHVLNRFVRGNPDAAITASASFTPEQRAAVRSVVEGAETVAAASYRNSLTEAKKAELLRQLQ